jgi:predicted nucleotidyltransferase
MRIMSTAGAPIADLPPAPTAVAADPVMRRIKAGLEEIYGPRLAGIVLYGSRARGDNRPDSDIDILVLVKDFNGTRDWGAPLHDLAAELFRMGPPEIEVNLYPIDAAALANRTGFMFNVRNEGLRL